MADLYIVDALTTPNIATNSNVYNAAVLRARVYTKPQCHGFVYIQAGGTASLYTFGLVTPRLCIHVTCELVAPRVCIHSGS